MRKLEQVRADRAEELKNMAIAMKGKAVSSEEAALAAAGWFTAQDQTGRLYYYNAMTRVTSWEVPNVAALPSPPPPPPPPGTDQHEGAANRNAAASSSTQLAGAVGETVPQRVGEVTQVATESSLQDLF